MALAGISVFTFPVPFRLVFKHASASRSLAENIIVVIRSDTGMTGYGEGCPREYVTGETVETAIRFVHENCDAITEEISDLSSLQSWIKKKQPSIDQNPAAFCAVELALLDLFSKAKGECIEKFLGLGEVPGHFTYSAVIGDSPFPAFFWQAMRYRVNGFQDYKIKISGDLRRDRRKAFVVNSLLPARARLRIDGNNFWSDAAQCVAHMGNMGARPFAIEEPLQPGDFDGCRHVAGALGVKIVLDESFAQCRQIAEVRDANTWIINLRVSKMGGILRSLDIVAAARLAGIGLIVGAQVGETSILTRASLAVMRACGDQLQAAEGAFGTLLLTRDLASPSLRFGPAGVFDVSQAPISTSPGFGLSVDESLLQPVQTPSHPNS